MAGAAARSMAIVFLSMAVVLPVESSLEVSCVGYFNRDYTMYGLFATPYANLDKVTGYLYHYELPCDSITLPPPFNISNGTGSILLLSNYSQCIIDRIVLASSMGYDAILTYTENDDNLTITEAVIETGMPLGIIRNKTVAFFVNNVVVQYANATNTTLVTVSGTIENGLVIVGFAFVFFVSFVYYFSLCACFCLKLFCEYRSNQADFRRLLDDDDVPRYANRQELIESILRHLHQLERDMGAQTPLGPENIKKFPLREYLGDEKHDTCTICVEEFKEGQTVRQLPCQHIFHPECIDEWLTGHSSLCPLCKINLREASAATAQSREAPAATAQSREAPAATAQSNGHGTGTLARLGVEQNGRVSHTGSTDGSNEELGSPPRDYGSVTR